MKFRKLLKYCLDRGACSEGVAYLKTMGRLNEKAYASGDASFVLWLVGRLLYDPSGRTIGNYIKPNGCLGSCCNRSAAQVMTWANFYRLAKKAGLT